MKKLLLTLIVLCAPTLALADIALTWTRPTQRVDGTALPVTEIASYKLNVTLNGNPLPTVSIAGDLQAHTFVDTVKGRYCFTLQTIDTDGLQSDPTQEVCRRANPKSPAGFSAR